MRLIKLATLGMLLILALAPPLQANEEIRVLVLISLDVTYPYVKSKVDGLSFEAVRQPDTILLDIQSIEDQRFTDPHQQHSYFSTRAEQFRNSKPDIILITGSPVIFDFYNEYIYPQMPDVPMVGETRAVPDNHKPQAYSFIEYKQNMPLTIDIALSSVRPKHVYLIGDATHPGSQLSMQLIEKNLPPDFNLPVQRLDMPFDELMKKLPTLPENSVAFYSLIFSNGHGKRMIPEAALQTLSSVSPFPIFAFHETMIGAGATGGMVAKGEDIGIQLIQEGLRAFKSGPFNPPRIINAKSTLLFDWLLLTKYQLDSTDFPADTEYIKSPQNLLEEYFYEFIASIIVIVIQGVMMVLLVFKIRQNQSLTHQLEQTLLQQEDRIAERTRELKKTTDRLSGLFDSLHSGVVVHGADTSILLSNTRANQILGLVSNQVIGSTAEDTQWNFTDRLGKHLVIKHYPLKEIIETGRPIKDYMISIGEEKRPSNRWLLVNGMPIYNNEGKVSEVVISFTDITKLKQSEQALTRSNSQLSAMFESRDDLIYVADPETYELLYVNPAFKKTWGEHVLKRKCFQVIQGEKSPCSFCTNDKIFGANQGKTHTWEYFNEKSGHWYRCVDKAIPWDDNHMVRFEIATDITQEKATNAKLIQAATVFDNTSEGIIIADLTPTIVDVNPAFSEITGYSRDEVIGKNPNILKSGKHDSDFYQNMWQSLYETGSWRGEIWNRNKEGFVYPELLTISMIQEQEGSPQGFVAAFSDITSIKQSQQRLDYLAHHDPLTDLPNRLLFNERLDQSIRRATRNKTSLAVAFIDLDRFKNINDSLGHHVGDELLQQISERLKRAIRNVDTVSRISGDEFVVLLEDVNSPEDTVTAIDKLMAIFQRPFKVRGTEIHTSCSVGISLFPQDGGSSNELLRNADSAMYRAKEEGRNAYQFYTQEMTSAAMEHVILENALRGALKREEFELVFQPQVTLDDSKLIGLEVLLRWTHPELGSIPPARFIPIAEQSGQIRDIGLWVLSEACNQGKQWLDKGYNFGRLAVNLSGQQLSSTEFSDLVVEVLSSTGLAGEYLELEITESFFMKNTESSVQNLQSIKQQGVLISIDDFGTGYSSLAYLKKLPISKLKIDHSFIRDIPDDSNDMAITDAIIVLGKALKLQIIAEGVETQNQLNFLKQHDCQLGQGYIFSPPLSVSDTEQLLSNSGKITISDDN